MEKKSVRDLLERKEAVSQRCKYILLQKSRSFHKPRQKALAWLWEDQIWLSSELIAFTAAGRAWLRLTPNLAAFWKKNGLWK